MVSKHDDWLSNLQQEADKLNLNAEQQAMLATKAKSLLDEWVKVDLAWDEGFLSQSQQGSAAEQALAKALLPELTDAYRETFTSEEAWRDVVAWAGLEEGKLSLNVAIDDKQVDAPVALSLYYPKKVPSLSETLPVLQNMGIQLHEELPFEIQVGEAMYGLSCVGAKASVEALNHLRIEAVQQEFMQLLQAVHAGVVENDGFNALVAYAGIAWRDTVMLRAIAKYLKQAVVPFSPSYMEASLMRHPQAVVLLRDIFHARLHPVNANEADADSKILALKDYCNDVNVDDDRIINAFLTVMLATVRTNFWQKTATGEDKATVSFKIQSGLIDFLPQPRPLFEIWVYSPRVEGVHLRGAKVARGGLRWSDRLEDFRTEVLGLVKAQMVKNSVIVPNGSKGGFVCKQAPSDRAGFNAEGVACYKLFIDSLLSLTDNLAADGAIVPPVDTFRRDADDPYLVVAADKGTAKFSDTANGLAAEHGFWLDDAFASGGSVGYDHKGMGITARGAWESVKRHFRGLGKDIQNEDFTVVGIGDMGGDVFGNGMLLSKHIRLQAAFNHMHIFLDPNPVAATSFEERKRLFENTMGWGEYNRDLISQGGGIFDRSAKHIDLSPEVQAFLGVKADRMAPSELIQTILKAEVELVYNGGIGTYIKSSKESHADAKDKANDAVRVNGGDLRCQVLGEGGNLGVTQLGRIEYFKTGGLCCTDAIDNSAGVDCSDHEVNIKILLGSVVSKGNMTLPERNDLLKSMTDEVGHLVLRNNYLQTQILAMNQLDAATFLPAHAELTHFLGEHAGLNRELEYLPSKADIADRAAHEQGFTSPETAVLLAYSKMHLQDALLASDIPDDVNFQSILINYFPKALQAKYLDEMVNHYLKREIIANQLANRMVNRMGMSFVQRFMTESEADVASIARAYWFASEIFNAEDWFNHIEALDNQVPSQVQMELMGGVARLISRVARGLLHRPELLGNLSNGIATYKAGVAQVVAMMGKYISADNHAYVAEQENRLAQFAALDAEDRTFLSRLPYAEHVIAMIDLAAKEGLGLETVVEKYFVVADALQMDWMYRAIASLPRTNKWQNQACLAVREDVQTMLLNVVAKCVDADGIGDDVKEQAQRQLREMQQYQGTDLAMLSALVRSLSRILLV